MSDFDEDIINRRDDVAAAVFAAQLGSELKFIDSQTTNRPNQQPPANRTNPQTFLRGPVQQEYRPQQRMMQQPANDPYEMSQQIIAPRPLQDIMIPMPNGVTLPQQTQAPRPQPAPQDDNQMLLPMTINEKGKPQNPEQWFNYLEKKLDDMDVRWTIEIQKVGKAVRDLTRVLEDRRIIKIKSKQEQQGTINV